MACKFYSLLFSKFYYPVNQVTVPIFSFVIIEGSFLGSAYAYPKLVAADVEVGEGAGGVVVHEHGGASFRQLRTTLIERNISILCH